MPMSMRGLGCVLMLVALTGSYGLAGAVAATLTLSQAFTAPWLGRLADRHGQRRLLVLALAAHSSGTVLLVLAAQVGSPAWTFFPAAALSGAAVLPVGSLVRARWAGLVGGTPALDTAFALESVLDEAVFVVGPVLVTALAVGVAPAAGLLGPLAFVVVGSLLLAVQENTEPGLSPEHCQAGRLAVLTPGVLVLILTCAAVGISLSVIDVGMVAFARERGAQARPAPYWPSSPPAACSPAWPTAPVDGEPRPTSGSSSPRPRSARGPCRSCSPTASQPWPSPSL
jgi:MFS family permease